MSLAHLPRPTISIFIHRLTVVGALLLALVATGAFSRRYDEDEEDVFASLIEQRSSMPRIKDHDFSYLLNNLNLGTPARSGYLKDNVAFGMMRLPERFPNLALEQRQFAVNPGYMSYYNPEYEHIENEREINEPSKAENHPIYGKEVSSNSEVVEEDPFDQGKADSSPTIIGGSRLPHVATTSPIKTIMDNHGSVSADKSASNIIILKGEDPVDNVYFTTIVAISSATVAFLVLGLAFCYHRVKRNAKAAEDVEYPAYGVTGPCKDTSPTLGVDRKLAQNAQMYHYQHQKRQMIAFDSGHHQDNIRGIVQPPGLGSDDESEDEGEEGDFTVYECPGLAPAGEMEVRNPMFADDTTPKANPNK